MDIKEPKEGYQCILEKFGEEKIISRYNCLYELLSAYLKRKRLEERIHIIPAVLDHVIVDYFVDIYRLKDFQGMELVNDTKILAYTSFWLLRHKPLQIVDAEKADDLVYVNEDAVGEILRTQLFKDPEDTVLLPEQAGRIDDFVNTMKYFFQYRLYTAQNIELMIMAFGAGRDYQYCTDFQE